MATSVHAAAGGVHLTHRQATEYGLATLFNELRINPNDADTLLEIYPDTAQPPDAWGEPVYTLRTYRVLLSRCSLFRARVEGAWAFSQDIVLSKDGRQRAVEHIRLAMPFVSGHEDTEAIQVVKLLLGELLYECNFMWLSSGSKQRDDIDSNCILLYQMAYFLRFGELLAHLEERMVALLTVDDVMQYLRLALSCECNTRLLSVCIQVVKSQGLCVETLAELYQLYENNELCVRGPRGLFVLEELMTSRDFCGSISARARLLQLWQRQAGAADEEYRQRLETELLLYRTLQSDEQQYAMKTLDVNVRALEERWWDLMRRQEDGTAEMRISIGQVRMPLMLRPYVACEVFLVAPRVKHPDRVMLSFGFTPASPEYHGRRLSCLPGLEIASYAVGATATSECVVQRRTCPVGERILTAHNLFPQMREPVRLTHGKELFPMVRLILYFKVLPLPSSSP